ncbi:MAG: carboxyl transferase domain-containing protein [Pseudonocardia sp.]
MTTTDVPVRSVERTRPSSLSKLADFLDAGTCSLLHALDDSGVQAVVGRSGGTRVVGYATDRGVMGGAMGVVGCRHIVAAIRTAVEWGCPVVGLWHSGGARLAEGVESLDGVGRVFAAIVAASGRVPQISVVLGPAAGGAAYGPALTDIVVMAPAGRIFVTGPDVVAAVTGEQVDGWSLGGPEVHGHRSGVAHVLAESESDALAQAGRLVALLARPGDFAPPATIGPHDPAGLLPASRRRAYDVRPVVAAMLDDAGDPARPVSQELQSRFAPNIVTALGRLAGRTVGVVANNPLRLAGCLDWLAAEKAARFVRLCDAAGVPLVVLVDVPGYLPGVDQEWAGVVRRGATARMVSPVADASRPTAHPFRSSGLAVAGSGGIPISRGGRRGRRAPVGPRRAVRLRSTGRHPTRGTSEGGDWPEPGRRGSDATPRSLWPRVRGKDPRSTSGRRTRAPPRTHRARDEGG